MRIKADLDRWVAEAEVGQSCCYHVGAMASATDPQNKVIPIVKAAYNAHRGGSVFLAQRLLHRDRHDVGTYEFTATKISSATKRRIDSIGKRP